jgi:hypothetical protein
MKRLAVSVLIVSSTLFACTNDDNKPSQSANAALDAIQTPTGTFDANNASGAFGKYGSDKTASSGLSSTGGGSGSSSTQARTQLRFLAEGAGGSCTEGASCACEGGGSFVYKRETTDYGPAIQAQFDGCTFADGSGFSGDMVLLASDKPLLKDDSFGDVDGKKSVLLAADGTFSSAKESVKANVVLLEERGVDYLAIEVSDGKIIIGVRESDGVAVVYAKDTLWVCTPSAGKYSCEDQNDGKKLDTSKSPDATSSAKEGSGASNGTSKTQASRANGLL